MIEITLPWPPTVNTYYRNYGGRIIISAKGRQYRKDVASQVATQQADLHIDYAVKMEIKCYRPDRLRRDLDNLLKALLDAMTHAGVMEDDALIKDLRVYWAEEAGGMVKVSITGSNILPSKEGK